MNQPRCIKVWGHYHGGNQGDDCSVAAVIQHLRRRCPQARIEGISLKPSDTERRHGIPCTWLRHPERRVEEKPVEGGEATKEDWRTARKNLTVATAVWQPGGTKRVMNRWTPTVYGIAKWVAWPIKLTRIVAVEAVRLVQSYRSLRGTDMLIVAGSNPITDEWYGPWGHPYSILRWSALAKLTGTRFVFLSVGAGPLASKLAKSFFAWSLKRAHYRSFRDEYSRRLIEGLGVTGENHVYPDLVFSLEMGEIRETSVPSAWRKRRLVVGLNPMPHQDPRFYPKGKKEVFEAYLRKLAEFAEWLLRNDYQVVVYYSDVPSDARVCDDLRNMLRERGVEPGEAWHEEPIFSFADIIERIKMCDVLVSSRYHCTILPMILHKPVLALAYHPKTFDLYKEMGQEDFALDMDQFQTPELIALFQRMERERETMSKILAERVEQTRCLLDVQYNSLLGSPMHAAETVESEGEIEVKDELQHSEAIAG